MKAVALRLQTSAGNLGSVYRHDHNSGKRWCGCVHDDSAATSPQTRPGNHSSVGGSLQPCVTGVDHFAGSAGRRRYTLEVETEAPGIRDLESAGGQKVLELINSRRFKPGAYAESVVLSKSGLTSRETLKKDRKESSRK
jgi:hypothetical protein